MNQLIPDVTQRPDNMQPSHIRSKIPTAMVGRRAVLRGMLGTGMAVGIGALDLFPFGRKAYAVLPSTWQHCAAYDFTDKSDDNDWRWCNPNGSASGHIGNSWCNDNGYHRIDDIVNSCERTYYRRENRCEGDTGEHRNAWEWHISDGGSNPGDPANVRCSDGKTHAEYPCDNPPREFTFNSTCKQSLPS